MSDYGDNFITITDEDGVEYELEILSTVEYNGALYYALVAAEDPENEAEQDLEVSILKAVEENGEELLAAVEDEEELETVYGMFVDQLYEDDEDEETDEV